MLFKSNQPKPRRRSYYPFSKNYPGVRGSSYDIGESRTRRKKDERNNIIFYFSLIILFIVVFIVSSVAIMISRKPIAKNNNDIAAEFNGAYKALYMPDEALDGGIAYDLFRTELTSVKANAVVVDFKRSDGMLNYLSNNETAIKIGATKDAYTNALNTINDLKKSGYKIIARIYCYQDSVAAAMISGAGIKEENSNTVWLDNSAHADGSPWLNPYSNSANNYLINIIKESIDSGADMVLLSAVSFPSSSRLDKAVFTTDEDAKPRNEILQSFIKRVASSCGDTPVAIYMPADVALNGSKSLYDGSIFESDAKFNAIDFRPDVLQDNFEFNGQSFKKESLSENSLIQVAIPQFKERISGINSKTAIIPIINDEIYISALENLEIESYILISE